MNARIDNRLALLEEMPKGAICAEIGVWDGVFSEDVLAVTRPTRVHLIDPWEYQPRFNNSAFGREDLRQEMEDKFHSVCRKFAGDPRVMIHRAYSHRAMARFGDGTLDWVYIDGNHNYQFVAMDLQMSLAKVKPDGIIAGDDLFWKAKAGAPVRKAVHEVLARLGDRVAFRRHGQQYILQLRRG